MLRLALIATALTLAACSQDSYDPTGVSFTRNIEDDRTVPQGLCDDSTAGPDYRLIPLCVDGGTPWPDNLFDVRSRHNYETVTVRSVGGGAKGKVRLF